MNNIVLLISILTINLLAYETFGCAPSTITNNITGEYKDNSKAKEIYINLVKDKVVSYEKDGHMYQAVYKTTITHDDGGTPIDIYLIGKITVLGVYNNFKSGVKILTEDNKVETDYNPCFKLNNK